MKPGKTCTASENRNVFNVHWRRGGDSNPRWACTHAAFRVRYNQPLCHLSKAPRPTVARGWLRGVLGEDGGPDKTGRAENPHPIARRAAKAGSGWRVDWEASLFVADSQRQRTLWLDARHDEPWRRQDDSPTDACTRPLAEAAPGRSTVLLNPCLSSLSCRPSLSCGW